MPDVTVRRRPDLEAMDVKMPNYIGGRIAPVLGRAFKTGTVYFKDIRADSGAQTGRSLGAAPTNNLYTAAKTTFDLDSDELIDRNGAGRSEIDMLGGILPAQIEFARKGRRAVGDVMEGYVAAAVLAATQIRDIGDSIIDAVDTAKAVIQDTVPGLVAFVCSQRIYNRISRYTEIAARMTYTGVPLTTIEEVRGLKARQMAAILNVDMVLIGPNSTWYDGSATYTDRAALVMIPETEDPIDPRSELQTLRMITLELEGTPDVLVESFYNSNLKTEQVDVQQWAELKTFNAEGIYTLTGIDEGNVVTTTTTA